ncbi:hypothetical protein CC80DRAFT_102633 [Byssothecium circinans]|uniref:Uncharacterized protein n=1 Tax=Byssothecium circinans TaxID=147558 RepID=A0A6A5UGD3_9PLEO|nr:hypothetical protein CC80DRAFT_102633 [Byssothecium circinans]
MSYQKVQMAGPRCSRQATCWPILLLSPPHRWLPGNTRTSHPPHSRKGQRSVPCHQITCLRWGIETKVLVSTLIGAPRKAHTELHNVYASYEQLVAHSAPLGVYKLTISEPVTPQHANAMSLPRMFRISAPLLDACLLDTTTVVCLSGPLCREQSQTIQHEGFRPANHQCGKSAT